MRFNVVDISQDCVYNVNINNFLPITDLYTEVSKKINKDVQVLYFRNIKLKRYKLIKDYFSSKMPYTIYTTCAIDIIDLYKSTPNELPKADMTSIEKALIDKKTKIAMLDCSGIIIMYILFLNLIELLLRQVV